MFQLQNFSLPVARHLSPSGEQIINFKAEEGSLSWVIGPAGSGKSLLLETLALRRQVSTKQKGTLTLFNYHIHSKMNKNHATLLKRHISVIDASPTVQTNWNVLDNVLLPLRLNGMTHSDMLKEVAPILNWLTLSDYKNTPLSRLSHALKQRVIVARALINRPALLLVDLNFLEPALQHQLLPAFSTIVQAGCTLLLTMPHTQLVPALPAPILTLPFPTHSALSSSNTHYLDIK